MCEACETKKEMIAIERGIGGDHLVCPDCGWSCWG